MATNGHIKKLEISDLHPTTASNGYSKKLEINDLHQAMATNGHIKNVEINDLERDLLEERKKCYSDEPVVCVGPKRYVISEKYKTMASDIYNMKILSDDVFVLGTSRAGTNWTQELVWMIANDLDMVKARNTKARERFPFLERSMLFTPERIEKICKENEKDEDFLNFFKKVTQPPQQLLDGLSSPRFVKTHLPLSLLPPDLLDVAKVVYVARDPRDVMISVYNFMKNSTVVQLIGDLNAHCNLFMKNALVYSPYLEHVKEAWERRDHPNMLFLYYEELSRDLPNVIQRVADFFGKRLDEQQITLLTQHLNINNLKSYKADDIEQTKKMNGECSGKAFIRKGKAGGWRDNFDEEMKEETERWIEENLKDTDFKFINVK